MYIDNRFKINLFKPHPGPTQIHQQFPTRILWRTPINISLRKNRNLLFLLIQVLAQPHDPITQLQKIEQLLIILGFFIL